MAEEKPKEEKSLVDLDKVLARAEELRKTGIDTKKLLAWVLELDKQLVEIFALREVIHDGSIIPSFKIHRDWAYTMYALSLVKDFGKELEKRAKEANEGLEDNAEIGLASRFAEELRTAEINQLKFACGTFSIATSSKFSMPSKKDPIYEKFAVWLRKEHPDVIVEGVQWQLFQGLCEELRKDGKLPEYIRTKDKEVVKIYNRS
jgi:hypothetical protein